MTAASVKVPSTAQEVIDQLVAAGDLITATEWRRAALVAAVVRLPGDGEGETPAAFAKRGIVGLRSESTVTIYVQNWLDAHGGKYPRLGRTVTLPTGEWPSTTFDDPRTAGVADRDAIRAQAEADGTGAAKALDIAKNKRAMAAAIKGSPAVAQAALDALTPEDIARAIAARPELADAITADTDAHLSVIQSSTQRASRGRRPRPVPEDGSAAKDATDATGGMVQLSMVASVLHETRKLLDELGKEGCLISRRPNVREGVVHELDCAIDNIHTIKALVMADDSVTDEALQDLLHQETGEGRA